eukprot:g28659.t1
MADQNEVLFQTSLTQDYAQAEGDPAEAAEEVPDQQQEEREHEDMMAEEEAAPLPVVAMDQEEEEVGVEVASLEEHGQAADGPVEVCIEENQCEEYGDAESCSELGSLQNDRWQDFVTWGASLITFGAAAGAVLLGPFVTHQLGRKPCIQMGGAVCFMGCLMASYLSFHNVAEFFLGRFITGLGVGLSCFALPLYNAEISTPQIRGATGSIFQLNVVIGCFVSCLVTLLDDDWYFGMVLPGLAGALLVLGGFFLPESPRFLMEKMVHQHPEEAFKCGLRSLKRIRSGDVKPEADQIFEQIRAEMETKHMGFRDLFRDPNLRKRVLIACTLVIGQQATGVNAFLGYAATLFKECGIENPILFDSIFNSIMILGCIAGLLLVDSPYAGRRSQLLVATALMGPPLTIAGFALRFGWPRIITMASVIIYGVGFQFAWGTIPWIYPAEIFSMSEKESAVSCAVGVNYVANAAVVYLTPGLMKWSTPGTLQIFGLLNILNALFVFLYIKETKGVPLEDIPKLFRPRSASTSVRLKAVKAAPVCVANPPHVAPAAVVQGEGFRAPQGVGPLLRLTAGALAVGYRRSTRRAAVQRGAGAKVVAPAVIQAAPAGSAASWRERLRRVGRVWGEERWS